MRQNETCLVIRFYRLLFKIRAPISFEQKVNFEKFFSLSYLEEQYVKKLDKHARNRRLRASLFNSFGYKFLLAFQKMTTNQKKVFSERVAKFF